MSKEKKEISFITINFRNLTWIILSLSLMYLCYKIGYNNGFEDSIEHTAKVIFENYYCIEK